jgi:transcription antitermination factor NusG
MWSLCALQILLPSVPRRKVLKDGRYSDARQRLYPGCLLVQCVLNREVYNFIRSVPGVWDFFGTRANTSVSDMIIPAAVSSIEIHEMFKRIEMEDAAFKEIREAANREADERERLEEVVKTAAKLEVKMPSLLQLEEGAMVRVNSGPFTNHTGVVEKINREEETVSFITLLTFSLSH